MLQQRFQRDGSVAQAEQMAARLNQAVAGIERVILMLIKDVYGEAMSANA